MYINTSPLNLKFCSFCSARKKLGVTSGFVGCLRDLKISHVDYDLVYPGAHIVEQRDITDCPSDPCRTRPCENGAQCTFDVQAATYACRCPHGFTGKRCQAKGEACSGTQGALWDNRGLGGKCKLGVQGKPSEKLLPTRRHPPIVGGLYDMVELAIRSVRKMTHAVWLPNHAVSLSYRLTCFGRKISEFDLKTNKPDSGTFYKRLNLQRETTKNVVKSS